MQPKDLVTLATAYAAAVITTAALGSVVQTQFNMAAIASLGVPVPVDVWAPVTGEDLMRFGPIMAAVAGAALMPALLLALFVARALPSWRWSIFAAAGVVGLWAAFSMMGFFTPMPTLVAAVRSTAGLAAMSATGVAGGLVFAWLSRRAVA